MGLPVQMFDYIGCHRPILILAYKDEEMWNVGKEISFAILLENNDSNNIACVIEELYKKHQIVEATENMSLKYHRRNLTSILSRIFDEVVKSTKNS